MLGVELNAVYLTFLKYIINKHFISFPDTTSVMNIKECQEEEIFISKNSIKLTWVF